MARCSDTWDMSPLNTTPNHPIRNEPTWNKTKRNLHYQVIRIRFIFNELQNGLRFQVHLNNNLNFYLIHYSKGRSKKNLQLCSINKGLKCDLEANLKCLRLNFSCIFFCTSKINKCQNENQLIFCHEKRNNYLVFKVR